MGRGNELFLVQGNSSEVSMALYCSLQKLSVTRVRLGVAILFWFVGAGPLSSHSQANETRSTWEKLKLQYETELKIKSDAITRLETRRKRDIGSENSNSLKEIAKDTGTLQSKAWEQATRIDGLEKTYATGLLLEALTEAFNTSTLKRQAFDIRIPVHVAKLAR